MREYDFAFQARKNDAGIRVRDKNTDDIRLRVLAGSQQHCGYGRLDLSRRIHRQADQSLVSFVDLAGDSSANRHLNRKVSEVAHLKQNCARRDAVAGGYRSGKHGSRPFRDYVKRSRLL
jgi:hypothetical protein